MRRKGLQSSAITKNIVPTLNLCCMGLSKSKYTTFRQCAKALWLRVNKPEEAVEDPSVEARFAAGNVVGDLAMGLFGDFVEVTTLRADGGLDLSAMIQKTHECIRQGVENICEASFSFSTPDLGSNYCAVDILRRQDDGYAIYEVKSSTGNDSEEKNKPADLEKYARDIAYQKWVLEQCGVKVMGTYLVRINNEYVLDGELDIQQLFHITDMAELVAQESLMVEGNVRKAKAVLESAEEPLYDLDTCCHKPYPCAFWEYCSRHVPVNSVFKLYRIQFRTALKYYKQGIISFEDVAKAQWKKPLPDKQQLQVASTLSNGVYIDKQGIREFLTQIRFPLYFLDFETEQPVLPKYQGTRPYQQIPFQYSLHWIEEEGGELKHTEFLGNGVDDPRRALAEQICRDIPLNVCTTAYNKGFECGRLREMADAFPDLAYHLRNIADHIVDLLDPFQEGYYYAPPMDGSFSIKKVLPALFPDDPALDYHNLPGTVHNGGEAMSIYPRMASMTPSERQATRQSLLEYCGLDTFAMVKVWQKLVEVSE